MRYFAALAAVLALALSAGCATRAQQLDAAWSAYHPGQVHFAGDPRSIGLRIVQDSAMADCIMRRESGYNPRAVSPTNDRGLWQINGVHAANFQRVTGAPYLPGVFDPTLNSIYARWLLDREGWRPWTTRAACS